jgi:signal transduction histidine kinase
MVTPQRAARGGGGGRMQQRAVTSGVEAVESGGVGKKLRAIVSAFVQFAFPRKRDAARLGELRRENEQLRDELDQLRQAVEHAGRLSALGTLAASIAHEIRNPLVAVRTFFQLAPQKWNDEEFAKDFRSVTEKEVLRISDLVTELLSIAKPPTRTMEDVDVDELIERTVMLLTPQARRHRVQLETVGVGQATFVHGAADQLVQVLVNLLLNAIEATPAGGAIEVRKSELAGPLQKLCRIEVRNTGDGIPAHLQDSIFDPFFTTKPGGTGLGLSIARRIVIEHEGCISVQSSTGDGARFCIDLPVSSLCAVRHAVGLQPTA